MEIISAFLLGRKKKENISKTVEIKSSLLGFQ